MADVFMVFASQQDEFAHKLGNALKACKRPDGKALDVWMNGDDTPVTVALWAEVSRGIEEADNVVLVVSTDSLGSPLCELEIEYARRLNKHLLALNHLMPDWDIVEFMADRRTHAEAE